MRPIGWLGLLAGAMAAGNAIGAPSPQFSVTVTAGANVRYVVYGENGKQAGEFRQTKGKDWEERDATGKLLFHYVEQARDGISVDLLDASRNVRARLDLKANTVSFAEGDAAMTPKYEMIYANAYWR